MLFRSGGNIFENYENSWRQSNSWADKKMILEKCINCEALNICGGGCRTSCIWNTKGNTSGDTMYIGDSLNKNQAKFFIDRMELKKYEVLDVVYKLKNTVKIRNDGVIFNSENQSFTVVNNKEVLLKDKTFRILNNKAFQILKSMDALEISRENNCNGIYLEISDPKNIFPRLGNNLNLVDKSYYLRADTGERYFF